MRTRARSLVLVGGLVVALAVGGCSDGDDDEAATTTSSSTSTTSTSSTTSTTSTSTTATTTAPPTSTTTTAPTTTTTAPLRPGDPCPLGQGIADCIDPEEDGTGVYLLGGDACIADLPPVGNPGMCSDLDGDGYAGYPDSG